MGNHKFRLSSMIPNAWFYKLKDMSTKPRNRNGKSSSLERTKPSAIQTIKRVSEKPSFSQQRYFSYHFSTEPNRTDHKLFCNSPINPKGSDTQFPLELPRRSSSTSRNFKRRSIYSPSPRLAVSSASFSPGCSCRATLNSFSLTDSSPEYEFIREPHSRGFEKLSSFSGCCNCRDSYSTTDIILEKFDDYYTIPTPNFNLKTTTTKVTKTRTRSSQQQEKSRSVSIKVVKKDQQQNPNPAVLARTSSIKSSTKGVKLRKQTPKLARKSISSATTTTTTTTTTKSAKKSMESFAIVKNSNDPERDFKDSMMEMIVENNIRASKDLEELLACYLLLNSNEYHDLIVKAFEHIWFDMVEDRI